MRTPSQNASRAVLTYERSHAEINFMHCPHLTHSAVVGSTSTRNGIGHTLLGAGCVEQENVRGWWVLKMRR
jgi:hypothetical protein